MSTRLSDFGSIGLDKKIVWSVKSLDPGDFSFTLYNMEGFDFTPVSPLSLREEDQEGEFSG